MEKGKPKIFVEATGFEPVGKEPINCLISRRPHFDGAASCSLTVPNQRQGLQT
jgi:hypothetical protein